VCQCREGPDRGDRLDEGSPIHHASSLDVVV
jgi:hypothetical protein